MSDTTQARRDALRERLTDIAEAWIAENGLERIKARPLAAAAGCSVGAIYTVFGDLTELVIAVNGRTFRKLGIAVTEATAGLAARPAEERLVAMSIAYLHFAADNTPAWRTLFDLEMSTDMEVPQWYLDALGALFALIAAPLREIRPRQGAAQIDLLTRTLFSSVHGIVLLGLEKRISGVPLNAMEDMIGLLLRNVTSQDILR